MFKAKLRGSPKRLYTPYSNPAEHIKNISFNRISRTGFLKAST